MWLPQIWELTSCSVTVGCAGTMSSRSTSTSKDDTTFGNKTKPSGSFGCSFIVLHNCLKTKKESLWQPAAKWLVDFGVPFWVFFMPSLWNLQRYYCQRTDIQHPLETRCLYQLGTKITSYFPKSFSTKTLDYSFCNTAMGYCHNWSQLQHFYFFSKCDHFCCDCLWSPGCKKTPGD